MKTLTSLLLILFMQGFLFHTALAKDSKIALVPLPSVDDFTRGKDGWGFGLGFGVEYESAYEGSDEFGFEVEPAGAIQWRKAMMSFIGRVRRWAGAVFVPALGYSRRLSPSMKASKEGDSDNGRLNGLGDGDGKTELVLQARRALDADWRSWLIGRVVTGGGGNLGLFGLGYRFAKRVMDPAPRSMLWSFFTTVVVPIEISA